jgi:predicted GNAT family acetyltransferase
MWYKIALKGHKAYYDFNDLSYELKQTEDSDESDRDPSERRMRFISYVLNAYDLEDRQREMPVGKMEFDVSFYDSGRNQLELKHVRTADWYEGMGVATNLYKWLKYNFENFGNPELLVSYPINSAAERIREKILGEPDIKGSLHEYKLDYSQGKLDI